MAGTPLVQLEAPRKKKALSTIAVAVGALITVGGLGAGLLGFSVLAEGDPDVWLAAIDDDLAAAGLVTTGATDNLTLDLAGSTGDSFQLRVSQGADLDIVVLDESGTDIFVAKRCKDLNPDDEIDDCTDYSTVSVGTFETGDQEVTLQVTGTGEVTVTDQTEQESLIAETFYELGLRGLLVGSVGCGCGVCVGVPFVVVALIIRFLV